MKKGIILKKKRKYLIHLSIASLLITYTWFIETSCGLKILDFGPKNTITGQKFNIQPSGKSALWFKVNGNHSKALSLKWDDLNLYVKVNITTGMVSAYIPNYLFENTGKHTLYLINTKDNSSSNKVFFNVVHNEKK